MTIKDKIAIGLNEKMSAGEIARLCSMSLQDVFNIINSMADKGIIYYPTYNSDGEIRYTLKKPERNDYIKLTAKNGMISFLGISDLHVGNVYDDLKRIDIVFNYLNKNGIHLILNGGDNIDGPQHENSHIPRRILTSEEQTEEFLSVYPLEDGVVTFTVPGDHETKYVPIDNKSFVKTVSKKRHDIKFFNSGSGVIKVNNKEILLCHKASDTTIKNDLSDEQFLVAGHSHEARTGAFYNGSDLSLRIILTSLSKLSDFNNVASGFQRIDFEVEKGTVKRVYTTFYMFKDNYELYRGPDNVYSIQPFDSFVKPRTRKKTPEQK